MAIALTDVLEPLTICLLLPFIQFLLIFPIWHLSLPELNLLLLRDLLLLNLLLLLRSRRCREGGTALQRLRDVNARGNVLLELSGHVDEDFLTEFFYVPV